MARTAAVSLFAFANLFVFAAAQTGCFWPDGSEISSPSDSTPCTSANSGDHLGTSNSLNTCCPTGWQCLSNGLCQNPNGVDEQLHSSDGLYGRYGCTSSGFQGCTNACLSTGESGAEALLQCSPGEWCCDGDRTAGNCCDQALPGNSPQFFGIGSTGQIIVGGGAGGGSDGSTSSAPPATSSAPATSSVPVSSEPPSSSSSFPVLTSSSSSNFPTVDSQTPTPSPTSFKSSPQQVSTSFSTSAGGGVVTEFVTTTPTAESSSSGGGSSSKTGLIVGCAVGIPVGLALIGAIIFFLWRRRRRTPARAESPPLGVSDGPYTDDYKHGPNAQVLGAAGFRPGPVGGPYEADSKPVSINNKDPKEAAELHSNSASPAIGSVNGQAGTPAPPYSAKFAQDNPKNLAELPAHSVERS